MKKIRTKFQIELEQTRKDTGRQLVADGTKVGSFHVEIEIT